MIDVNESEGLNHASAAHWAVGLWALGVNESEASHEPVLVCGVGGPGGKGTMDT